MEENKPLDTNSSPHHPGGVEGQVFGTWTIRLRNICGVMACIVVCYNSLIYTQTIQKAVLAGFGWPDRTSLAVMAIGPIVIAFVFIDASKILRILTKLPGIGERLRKGTVNMLSRPGDRSDNTPPQPTQDQKQ